MPDNAEIDGGEDWTAAEVANDFNWRHYGVPAPRFPLNDEPCPYRSCAGCDEVGESCRSVGCPATSPESREADRG